MTFLHGLPRPGLADENNSGQFGNRSDTEEQARKGGEASTGTFGSENGAYPSETGNEGAQARPREAKDEGGQNSHQGDGNNAS